MRELTFYFDFISTNAYLAWTQLDKLPVQLGRGLHGLVNQRCASLKLDQSG